jgi:hypothetical protein
MPGVLQTDLSAARQRNRLAWQQQPGKVFELEGTGIWCKGKHERQHE